VIEERVQHRYVANRDARRFLPFLLPYVRSGMSVLDVGCGIGSIALDLAPTVAPGRMVGIDADAGQIEVARRSAAERGTENAEFFTASVYELPFEASTFDVVYANAVLMYVRDQVRALVEMRRVLRPGGLAAVTDDDLGTVVISPDRPELELAPRLFERAIAHEGGNARYSRRLRTLMLEAGFERTQGVAHAPEVYGDLASTRWFAEFAVGLFAAPSMADVIIGEGWATRAELDAIIAALHDWGELPDAFASWLYCGALGWVSSASPATDAREGRRD
jgi:SAM-dependent methyltransferase